MKMVLPVGKRRAWELIATPGGTGIVVLAEMHRASETGKISNARLERRAVNAIQNSLCWQATLVVSSDVEAWSPDPVLPSWKDDHINP